MRATLPPPAPAALLHSQQLIDVIQQRIIAAQGYFSFYDFMQMALYEPQLGYYVAGLHKFGEQGDFVTAPEISPLFSYALAHQCQQVLQALTTSSATSTPVILELGAGSGKMAAHILQRLAELDSLPAQYWILEVSPDLQALQAATLQQIVPDLLERVHWLTQFPPQFEGIVLANEVVDAMPVRRFQMKADSVHEFFVGCNAQGLYWHTAETQDEALRQHVESLRPTLPVDYISEYHPQLQAWMQGIAYSLQRGVVLLIDYGFPRATFYHPQRSMGTLMCHYRHHSHDEPLILVGLQDITAHVDFTALAEAGIHAGLQLEGYTTQANFLIACGLMQLLEQFNPEDSRHYLSLTTQVKRLLFPSEMGELFKVIAFSQQLPLNLSLLGFDKDERGRL